MKTGRTLSALAQEIERRAAAKQDLIAPVGKLEMAVEPQGDKALVPVLAVAGRGSHPLTHIAHGQLAEYTGIPAAYYGRLQAQDPALLATNVNRWLQPAEGKAEDRRLVRVLDGNVRAFLSDKYRMLDNEDFAEAILPVLLDRNLLILSCEITERRLYIKAVDRTIERDVPTGRKMGDGTHTIFDTCAPAITVSNSELGFGRLSIETGVYTKACTNLAMFGAALKKHHLGSRADISEDVYSLLKDDTKKTTDAAIWLQARDVIGSAFDASKFEALTQRLGHASKQKIPVAEVTEVVEVVGKRYSFNEGERKGVLARLIEAGDFTRYGLHAAVTRHSADVEDYDRATELERVGGQIIELPPDQFEVVLKEAA